MPLWAFSEADRQAIRQRYDEIRRQFGQLLQQRMSHAFARVPLGAVGLGETYEKLTGTASLETNIRALDEQIKALEQAYPWIKYPEARAGKWEDAVVAEGQRRIQAGEDPAAVERDVAEALAIVQSGQPGEWAAPQPIEFPMLMKQAQPGGKRVVEPKGSVSYRGTPAWSPENIPTWAMPQLSADLAGGVGGVGGVGGASGEMSQADIDAFIAAQGLPGWWAQATPEQQQRYIDLESGGTGGRIAELTPQDLWQQDYLMQQLSADQQAQLAGMSQFDRQQALRELESRMGFELQQRQLQQQQQQWAAEMQAQQQLQQQQLQQQMALAEMERKEARNRQAQQIGLDLTGMQQQSWAQGLPYALPKGTTTPPGFEIGGPVNQLATMSGQSGYSPMQIAPYNPPQPQQMMDLIAQAIARFGT